jgi:hypothetical protein
MGLADKLYFAIFFRMPFGLADKGELLLRENKKLSQTYNISFR